MDGDIELDGRTYRVVGQDGRTVVFWLRFDAQGQQFTTTIPRGSTLWKRVIAQHRLQQD